MNKVLLTVVGTIVGSALAIWIGGERGLRPRPSTRQWMREQGLQNFLNGTALHSYIYLRWTRRYIDIAINRLLPNSNVRGRNTWIDRYHGKVLTTDQARAVVTLNRRIERRDLEQIIPYPAARDLVLNGPPDIVAYECACRNARARPCRPTQVCMVIGKPFTDFILEHQPKTSRRLDQGEALKILRQEHERGHVHSAWFKDVMLNRFYAICNCCSCCCGGMDAMLHYNTPVLASSGFVARIDAGSCVACGVCERKCPFRAVTTTDTTAVQWDRCMGCGVCASICPKHAISLIRDERKGVPFDVRAIV